MRRTLKITRIDTNRDPMMPGVQWYGAYDLFATPTAPTADLTPIELPPLPPVDPQQERWRSAVDLAASVIEAFRVTEPDFDPQVLHGIITDALATGAWDKGFTPDDVLALYRRKKGQH